MPISRTDIAAATTLANSIGPLNEDLNDAYDAINANEAATTALSSTVSTTSSAVGDAAKQIAVGVSVVPGGVSSTQVVATVERIALLDSAGDFGVILENPALGTLDITVSGLNGLDTGAEGASTWYHVWLVAKTGGTLPGLLFSLSASWPTMPAGYIYGRRICSRYNNSASNLFVSYRDESSDFVTYDAPRSVVFEDNGAAGTTWGDLTFPVVVDLSPYVPPSVTLAEFSSRLSLITAGAAGTTVFAYIHRGGGNAMFEANYEDVTSWGAGSTAVSVNNWNLSFPRSNQALEWQISGASTFPTDFDTNSYLRIEILGYWDSLAV